VQRPEFMAKYQSATTAQLFVAALIQSVQLSGTDLNSQRDSLIALYASRTDQTNGRALVVEAVADHVIFKQSQYNRAFVLMQYFGYLQRDIDQGGYDFWVDVLNSRAPNNYRGMVCAFVTSTEYQKRFSRIANNTNAECGD
jgi:hypothetical protein